MADTIGHNFYDANCAKYGYTGQVRIPRFRKDIEEPFMADEPKETSGDTTPAPSESGATATKSRKAVKPTPKRKPPGTLPPWKVLLHNDDKNDMRFVIDTIVELTPLNTQDAEQRMREANDTGLTLLLVTHKERAELYKDQFESKGLTVTIEPAEKS
jgi:ATP-dependent Clp protease adaptor protein ClpS